MLWSPPILPPTSPVAAASDPQIPHLQPAGTAVSGVVLAGTIRSSVTMDGDNEMRWRRAQRWVDPATVYPSLCCTSVSPSSGLHALIQNAVLAATRIHGLLPWCTTAALPHACCAVHVQHAWSASLCARAFVSPCRARLHLVEAACKSPHLLQMLPSTIHPSL